MDVTNQEFLYTIFGGAWTRAHVSAFADDPGDIKQERRAACWSGGSAQDKLGTFNENDNQYYTISVFDKDGDRAVRRIANFEACYIIVADDVKEKLDESKMAKLPPPTYKLLTSENSEQWGWVLEAPCFDAHKVTLLVDGLIAKGSDTKIDPGMKGITRYVRLPGGSNTKKSRLIDGAPFKCQLLDWRPDNYASIDELASTFDIDLSVPATATRKLDCLSTDEARKHPIFDHVKVTGVGNDGWIRIDCLNAAQHSGDDVTGAAVQVNIAGDLNYSCHHGHCQGEATDSGCKVSKFTGAAAIAFVDDKFYDAPGMFTKICADYRREIKHIHDERLKEILDIDTTVSYSVDSREPARVLVAGDAVRKVTESDGGKLSLTHDQGGEDSCNLSDGQKTIIEPRAADSLDTAQVYNRESELFDQLRYIYLFNDNKFYDTKTGLTVVKESLDNRYRQQFPGGKHSLVCSQQFFYDMDREFSDAEGLTWRPRNIYAPDRSRIIETRAGKRLINTWRGVTIIPEPGDVKPWLDHAEYLLPNEEERNVVLDYFASLFQRINEKPEFALIHSGGHGAGKDLFYKPICKILGEAASVCNIDDLIDGWGDFREGKKLIILSEVDKGHDKKVANALKTLTASVATEHEKLNIKHKGVIDQFDCKAVILLSNRENAVAIEEGDRRYYAVESYCEPKTGSYYTNLSNYYNGGGVAAIFDYLMKRDISKFNHKRLPGVTAAARKMMHMGLYDYEQDIQERAETRTAPFDMQIIAIQDLQRDLQALKIKCSNNGLHNAMKRLDFVSLRAQYKENGKKRTTPTFFAAKKHVEAYCGIEINKLSNKNIREYYDAHRYKASENTLPTPPANVIPIK